KAMTRANVGPLSVRARVFGRGNSRVSAIVAHLSNHASRVLFGHLQAILRFLYDGGAQQARLDADRAVPGGDQEDHRGAGDAHETEIRSSAAAASLRHWVCVPSQRPTRNLTTWRVPENCGRKATTTAARTPATATTRKPARTVQERASAIATDASGASAALSS